MTNFFSNRSGTISQQIKLKENDNYNEHLLIRSLDNASQVAIILIRQANYHERVTHVLDDSFLG